MSTTALSERLKLITLKLRDGEQEDLNSVETFETYRTYLFSIAYRMLGSVMDAEDMVQETYLRYQTNAPVTIRSLKAYLTTILVRLCIDQLHLAYKQRETYLGPWLPEPILTVSASAMNAEEATIMEESVSLAFLTLMEQLQPAERAVFILREVFDYDYREIADFVGRKEAACRQLFSRARKHLAEHAQYQAAPPELHRKLLASFIQAVQEGDQSVLLEMLTQDAQLVADGGGKVPGAATYPIMGREAISRFAIGVKLSFIPPTRQVEFSNVNYQPAIIVRSGGRALVVFTIEIEDRQVKTVRFMANPDKLHHL